MYKYDYKKDGITQGALAVFMLCREAARLSLKEGWSSKRISKPFAYGTIIHGLLEHVYEAVRKKELTKIPSRSRIRKYSEQIEKQWYRENPRPDKDTVEFLETSFLIAEKMMPTYFRYWWKEDFHEIKWKSLEQKFEIPFKTSCGYRTTLRGKKDGLFQNLRLWLFETKTKSRVNEGNLLDALWFELQVNLYLYATYVRYGNVPSGVLYNIIRKTCIDRRKNENMYAYVRRVIDDVERRPEFYFIRYKVHVTESDLFRFERELDGMVTDFINWIKGKVPHYKNTGNCENKYGRCQFLPICSTGDYFDFEKRKVVYRELEDY